MARNGVEHAEGENIEVGGVTGDRVVSESEPEDLEDEDEDDRVRLIMVEKDEMSTLAVDKRSLISSLSLANDSSLLVVSTLIAHGRYAAGSCSLINGSICRRYASTRSDRACRRCTLAGGCTDAGGNDC